MNVLFYCSSKTGAGFRLGEFSREGALRSAAAGGPSTMFLNMGGLDYLLMRTGGDILLILKRIEPPSEQERRVDFSGADIRVNLAFIAQDIEEARLRALAVYALNDKQEFAREIYAAYNHNAGGELGYDFDRERVMRLIERAAEKYLPALSKHPTPLAPAKYETVNERKAVEKILAHTFCVSQGVLFARTEMDHNVFVSTAGIQNLPWYVISDVYKPIPDAAKAPAPLWKKLLRFMFTDKNGKFSIKRTGISLSSLALVILVSGILISAAFKNDTPARPAYTPAPPISSATPTATRELSALTTPAQLPAPYTLDAERRIARAGDIIVWALSAPGVGENWVVECLLTKGSEFAQNFIGLQSEYEYRALESGEYTLTFIAHSPDETEYITCESTITVYAAERSNGLAYTRLQSGELCVYDYAGDDFDLTVPDTYLGMKVTSIAAGAFSGSGVTHITLGRNIRQIDYEAFDSWEGVTISALKHTYAYTFAREHQINMPDEQYDSTVDK